MSLLKSNVEFTSKISKSIFKSEDDVVFSPLSISTILTMCGKGAVGKTKEELFKLLHIPIIVLPGRFSSKTVHDEINDLLRACSVNNCVDLNFGIFTQTKLLPLFVKFAEEKYLANVQKTSFENPGRKIINSWVSKRTEGKINELIKEGTLNSFTNCVLINTIFLKASWKFPFDKELTKERIFYGFDKKEYKVPMMTSKGMLFYSKHSLLNANKQIIKVNSCSLELGGKRNTIRMVFILPKVKGKDAYKEVEEALFHKRNIDDCYNIFEDLSDLIGESDKTVVEELIIPKFKIESRFENLVNIFKDNGVTVPFSTGAEFPNVSKYGMIINKVIHQAVMSIDETGVEASAATAITAIKGGGGPKLFICNRPFICLLYDTCKKTLYFVARKIKF